MNLCYVVLMLCCFAKVYAYELADFDGLMGGATAHFRHVTQEKDYQLLEMARQNYLENYSFQETSDGPYKIPPVVHLIWLGPNPFPMQSVENVRTWIAHNPHWKIKFWTDREREAPCSGMEVILIQDSDFSRLLAPYHASENWGEKSDLLRFEILSREGGVYVDHDANCLRPFDGMHRGYDFYCCLETPHEAFVGRNVTCGNGVIGARPGHPVVERVIALISERWDALGKAFRGRDDYSRTEIVMHRTYIALTDALEGAFGAQQNRDIILPAAYFFAKSGMDSVYSRHFYGSLWDLDRMVVSPFVKLGKRALGKIERGGRQMMGVVIGVLSLNIAILGLCVLQLKKIRKKV